LLVCFTRRIAFTLRPEFAIIIYEQSCLPVGGPCRRRIVPQVPLGQPAGADRAGTAGSPIKSNGGRKMPRAKQTMDGNTAAAHVAYAFTDVAAIYPIT